MLELAALPTLPDPPHPLKKYEPFEGSTFLIPGFEPQ